MGAVVNTATVNGITPVLLNQTPSNTHSIYEVDFAIPGSLSLGAGTYWLELHEGASLTAGNNVNFRWAIASGINGNALAFQLDGAPNTTDGPEPQSIALTCLGLAALCGRLYKNWV